MQAIEVKIINQSNNPLPKYATLGSSGVDLQADLTQAIILNTLERTLVPTGVFLEMPLGIEAQIRPRSGLAIKQGITCLNTPGTIDSDYRGEIKVILINVSNKTVVINHGDRIAQMVFAKVLKADFNESVQISVTERGTGGFGSTGN